MRCSRCSKISQARCGQCLTVAYCSEECQKEDWKSHQSMCKLIEAKRKRDDRSMEDLIVELGETPDAIMRFAAGLSLEEAQRMSASINQTMSARGRNFFWYAWLLTHRPAVLPIDRRYHANLDYLQNARRFMGRQANQIELGPNIRRENLPASHQRLYDFFREFGRIPEALIAMAHTFELTDIISLSLTSRVFNHYIGNNQPFWREVAIVHGMPPDEDVTDYRAWVFENYRLPNFTIVVSYHDRLRPVIPPNLPHRWVIVDDRYTLTLPFSAFIGRDLQSVLNQYGLYEVMIREYQQFVKAGDHTVEVTWYFNESAPDSIVGEGFFPDAYDIENDFEYHILEMLSIQEDIILTVHVEYYDQNVSVIIDSEVAELAPVYFDRKKRKNYYLIDEIPTDLPLDDAWRNYDPFHVIGALLDVWPDAWELDGIPISGEGYEIVMTVEHESIDNRGQLPLVIPGLFLDKGMISRYLSKEIDPLIIREDAVQMSLTIRRQ